MPPELARSARPPVPAAAREDLGCLQRETRVPCERHDADACAAVAAALPPRPPQPPPPPEPPAAPVWGCLRDTADSCRLAPCLPPPPPPPGRGRPRRPSSPPDADPPVLLGELAGADRAGADRGRRRRAPSAPVAARLAAARQLLLGPCPPDSVRRLRLSRRAIAAPRRARRRPRSRPWTRCRRRTRSRPGGRPSRRPPCRRPRRRSPPAARPRRSLLRVLPGLPVLGVARDDRARRTASPWRRRSRSPRSTTCRRSPEASAARRARRRSSTSRRLPRRPAAGPPKAGRWSSGGWAHRDDHSPPSQLRPPQRSTPEGRVIALPRTPRRTRTRAGSASRRLARSRPARPRAAASSPARPSCRGGRRRRAR